MSDKKQIFVQNPEAAIASFVSHRAEGKAVSPLILRSFFGCSIQHASQLFVLGRMSGNWHGDSKLCRVSTPEERQELKAEFQASDKATAQRISREFKNRFK